MKVYLAHNFESRDWLRTEIKPLLEKAGHQVTSRWISDDSHLLENTQQQSAVHDLEDIDSASHLFFFLDQFGDRPGKGKFVEMGYAIRAGKIVVLIGDDNECVFNHLPNLRKVKNVQEAIKYAL